MKTARKALVLAACAIMLVCATIAGTLAYLTSKAEVKNTFTVGNVNITMDETNVDKEKESDPDRDTVNEYKLLPGQTYTKDPTITVTAKSEDCYIFVKVDNQIAAVEDGEDTILQQMTANNRWVALGSDYPGVYYYNGTGAENGIVKYSETDTELDPVFSHFTVSSTVQSTDLQKVNGMKINVTAYAIQAEGFDSAAEAWKDAGAQAQGQDQSQAAA